MDSLLPIITDLYTCNYKTRIRTVLLSNDAIKLYSMQISKIENVLIEIADDEPWRGLLRRLKTLRFELYATPLPKDYLKSHIEEINQEIIYVTKYSSLIFPAATELLKEIQKVLLNLSESWNTQLIRIREIIIETGNVKAAIVVKEPKLVTLAESAISPTDNLLVLTPPLLRESIIYDLIFVIGPPRWFPEYVFSAPRSKNIFIFQFKWIQANWRPEKIFENPVIQSFSTEYTYEAPPSEEFDTELLTSENLLPPGVDIDRLSLMASLETQDRFDYIEARLYVLENNWAVFLEADDKSIITIIDLDVDINPIRRINIGNLETGMFILLRTSGGGDFIIPVANRILGNESEIAREFQKEWKMLLRTYVRRLGVQKTNTKLIELGSHLANPMNLRNWMSERSIRTEDIDDFSAIMKLIGLERDIALYWEMLKKIDRAHRLAGHQIREMLLEQVKTTSIRDLKKMGMMDFNIPGENVSITAFRVNRIEDKVNQVMPWRIGNPIEPE
jgi:hypothetical protein